MTLRRAVVARTIGAVLFAAIVAMPAAAADQDVLRTADQRAIELQAARLMTDKDVIAAKAKAAAEWRRIKTPPLPAEQQAHFYRAVDELVMAALIGTINNDPTHPRIHLTQVPAHVVDGVTIPSSRYAGDNPDTIYRTIPVDGTSHYVIRGWRAPHPPSVNEFSLLTANQVTLANLAASDLQVASDGSFTITIDPDPAGGRPNHLQTTAEASRILIRDTLGDWSRERPNSLTVRRLEPAAGPAARPDRELVRELVASLPRYVADNERFIGLSYKGPANEFRQPVLSRENGFLATQAYSLGHFRLSEGEALIITVNPGGADYVIVPVNNVMLTSNDPVHHLASLNNRQASPNPDGTFTIVVSLSDPGIHNWVDPEGMHEGLIAVRWAGFAAGAAAHPAISARLVRLSELAGALPADTRKVTAGERREQLATRARDYAARSIR